MISVACIMPTIPQHHQFVARAVDCFLKQVFPANWNVQLVIDTDPKPSLGQKLNRMIASTNADYIVLWDSDDFFRNDRIAKQVTPLIADGYLVSGSSKIIYQDGKEAYLYTGDPAIWLYGLAFPPDVWQAKPFDNISFGVDTDWLKHIPARLRHDCDDPVLSIATAHSTNTCPKHFAGAPWSRVDYNMVVGLMA